MTFLIKWLAQGVDFGWYRPDITQLPGGGTAHDLVNGLAGYVLVVLVAAMVIAAGFWGVGRAVGNAVWAVRGTVTFLACAGGALLAAAAPFIVSFFTVKGTGIH